MTKTYDIKKRKYQSPARDIKKGDVVIIKGSSRMTVVWTKMATSIDFAYASPADRLVVLSLSTGGTAEYLYVVREGTLVEVEVEIT